MTSLRIIERQLMQRANAAPQGGGSGDAALLGLLEKLQTMHDSEKLAAVQAAEQRMKDAVDRVKKQLDMAHMQLAAARDELATQRRAQMVLHDREMRASRDQLRDEHEAHMKAHHEKMKQEHEAATQAARAELDRERQARMQAEAKLAAVQESHATLTQAVNTLKAMKPTPQKVVEVPVKGKPTNWAFEIRRRGDGLIDGVIAKPL